jgi:hypothetical protein
MIHFSALPIYDERFGEAEQRAKHKHKKFAVISLRAVRIY